ncbi:cation diffusion facilitator family transporter [Selenihalanaerobacter shriftii]|uniref:Cation diffusion facilitator family transporter n=1 Tax=Selenihalanaerobacter shriftii TaxID=142842 RepID=A0A1T4KCX7_9FIRM|nr:cation diffusion facilitator family transporter [Selenihalanaerobacter shriftii]SJZ40175.1 cation diffusion facilitator family transporter [Selenihalanaerobacter shriftii]
MEAEYRYKVSQKISIITLIANVIFAGAKIFIGTVFHSQALVADGIHSASDAVSTITVMVGNKISKAPPDEEHPYGHGKAESIATKVLGIILIIGGLIILKETIYTILYKHITIPGRIVLWAAIVSVLFKEIMYRYTYQVGKKVNNKALIADAIHHRTDAFSSIAALIGAAGARLGYPILDPIAGLIVALLILKMGIEVFKDAANELMDAAPAPEKFNEVLKILGTIDEVLEVSNLKIRPHGPNYCIDVRVVVDNHLSVVEGHEVAVKVKQRIKDQSNHAQEVLVHVDPKGVQHSELGY